MLDLVVELIVGALELAAEIPIEAAGEVVCGIADIASRPAEKTEERDDEESEGTFPG